MSTPPTPEPAADPSMDDILASIRRILNEDEGKAAEHAPADDVLVLDSSMLVPEETKPLEATPFPPLPAHDGLVAPEAAAVAQSHVGELVRTLAQGRATTTHRGGPTIEDLVREEMRPLLKEWLDHHLPPLVERLVRAEIERVISRITA